jgi:hypothetical protein
VKAPADFLFSADVGQLIEIVCMSNAAIYFYCLAPLAALSREISTKFEPWLLR